MSKHAQDVMREREIQAEWVAATLAKPALREPDPTDERLSHALLPIADFGYRVLRVVYNHTVDPVNVVTAFFDRAMKGKL